MSGGHWDYVGGKIATDLKNIADDENVKSRWPLISLLFSKLALIIYEGEHYMDLDLSGDKMIYDDKDFDLSIMCRMRLMMEEMADAKHKRIKAK